MYHLYSTHDGIIIPKMELLFQCSDDRNKSRSRYGNESQKLFLKKWYGNNDDCMAQITIACITLLPKRLLLLRTSILSGNPFNTVTE